MDRTNELREIYEKSGLKELFDLDPVIIYFEKEKYTKLKFGRNDFGVRSIELWDLKSGEPYFKIHHGETHMKWLRDAMKDWQPRPESKSNRVGASFDGDPLRPAKLLADLLRSRK